MAAEESLAPLQLSLLLPSQPVTSQSILLELPSPSLLPELLLFPSPRTALCLSLRRSPSTSTFPPAHQLLDISQRQSQSPRRVTRKPTPSLFPDQSPLIATLKAPSP